MTLTHVVNEGGLGEDISDLPVAGAAPEWMSEELEDMVGGKFAFEPDPVKAAHLMIDHIDKKRAALKLKEVMYA